ncbi:MULTISPECIES: late competence development ComFB family protein [Pseudoalteromonas]|uniref:Competence protein ComFB n=1 Tax=Pseudoalteromonas rubra TaxID=43658 RepID=A0A5S3X198_9GAMM|nr:MULTISPECIES: late competence development ComFB family protein [Pseudoalteromonas]AZZ97603.1 competence protein ComFB [Pseudoalteromonas sp. R3]MCO7186943.1 late competence development ComFB family protein [Pseudoalteromonas sp. XMcav2-N]TMP38019.1 competence protein ComFB [Pseudoalteromonas rubra]
MKLHDDLHNYYEKIVLENIEERGLDHKYDEDVMADLCCTALNRLPARYIRYDVDMEFYLPTDERTEMEAKVKEAVDYALAQIAKKKQFQP